MQQELSLSEKKSLMLSIEVQKIQSDYDSAIAELHVLRGINQEQEEKIMKLSKEIETATRNITNNVSKIKLMQTKIDELRSFDSVSQISNIDLLHLKDLSNDSQEENLANTQVYQLDSDYLKSNHVKDYCVQEFSRDNSFHTSIEAIWEECKEIVRASSKKSHQIQELEKQIEKLKTEVESYKDESHRLEIKECDIKHQGDLLKEKESIIQQLKEELQEKMIILLIKNSV